jgi:sirohydrochlorin ferrochelatase
VIAVAPEALRTILLVDHGSRREEANAQIDAVAQALRRRAGGARVRIAHLELAEPSIGDAIDACAAEGVTEIVLVPWFLGPGRHTSRDIPEQAAAAARRHAGLRLRIADPLGLHEKLVDVVLERADRARDL